MRSSSEIRQIIAKKVHGKIVAQHTEAGHFYAFKRTGKVVRSVTTKLIIEKPHLIPWAVQKGIEWLEADPVRWDMLKTENRNSIMTSAKFIHTGHRDEAGDIGGQGHQVIEDWVNDWIRSESDTQPGDIKSYIKEGTDYRVYAIARSAEAFFKKNNVIPIASEILVGMQKYNSAGTLDMLVLNKNTGELELWDWKSSNAVNQDTYPMQIAAYKKFFESMTKLKISICKIIKLDKYSDNFKAYTLIDPKSAFDAFAAISKVYDWKYNNEVKLLEDKSILVL